MRQALDFEKFLHQRHPMPALIKVGLAHSQFETIHPILDGNERVGRLLITFLLCEREKLKRALLYLSHYFKLNSAEYYDRLQAVRDRGNWEGWLKLFLQGVVQVAEEATVNVRRIVKMREEHRELILNRLGRASGTRLQLLERLYFRPIVSWPKPYWLVLRDTHEEQTS